MTLQKLFSVLVENHALLANVDLDERVREIVVPFYIHKCSKILISDDPLHHTTAPWADDVVASHHGQVGSGPHLQPHSAVDECQLFSTRTVLP